MEIDITNFFNNATTTDFSDSIANSGFPNIGEIIWKNARIAEDDFSFVNKENIEKFIDFFESFGAWEREELEDMDRNGINALFIQYISGDISEYKELCGNWDEYQKASEQGQVSGCIFPSKGKIYFLVDV